MPEPTLGLVLLLGSAVLVGALVQGSVGFGIVVVAAPFVIWAAPELMPGSMLVCGFVMPLLQLTTRWRDVDWVSLRAALAGRLAADAGRGLGGGGVEHAADRVPGRACWCSWWPWRRRTRRPSSRGRATCSSPAR